MLMRPLDTLNVVDIMEGHPRRPSAANPPQPRQRLQRPSLGLDVWEHAMTTSILTNETHHTDTRTVGRARGAQSAGSVGVYPDCKP